MDSGDAAKRRRQPARPCKALSGYIGQRVPFELGQFGRWFAVLASKGGEGVGLLHLREVPGDGCQWSAMSMPSATATGPISSRLLGNRCTPSSVRAVQ